jgi:hypothetical protein
MSYAQLDDLYDDTRKIKRAWKAHAPNPVGLHSMAITYCQRHRTDGMLPDDWLDEMLPKPRERAVVLATMVEHRLFDLDPHDEGQYRVHNFLKRNASRADREAKSKAAAEAAAKRWSKAGSSA